MATVDTSELRGLANDFADARRDLPDNARRVVRVNSIRMADFQRAVVAVDTGATKASIDTDYDTNGLGSETGPTTKHSRYLEYGTSRMRPQPFVIPSAVYIERPFYADCADLTDVFGPER